MSVDIERLKVDADYWDEVAPMTGAKYYCPRHRYFLVSHCGCFGSIPRPTSPEWVDGLPPVGCECEMKHGGTANYVDVLIIGYYDTPWGDNGKAVVVKCPSLFPDESDYVSPINIDSSLHFRPIQTPEQRQLDELQDLCEVALAEHDKNMVHECSFDAFIDAILSKYNLTEK